MTVRPLSGETYTLSFGEYEAEIASVGATVRCLRYGRRDLIVPFAADELRPVFRGALLAPWPNRVVDGSYRFGDRSHQLALTEPERGHALHGLAAWLAFEPMTRDRSMIELAAAIEPQEGYPWRVQLVVGFSLGSTGLVQTVSATNEGAAPAPLGLGAHPYLVGGAGPVDEWTLTLPASDVLTVTPDRLCPVDLVGVDADGGRWDFRIARPVGATVIDHAFTNLTERSATVTSEGTGVRIAWDASCGWVQVCTGDQPEGKASASHRVGLAVEPMTCAPDAFNADSYGFDTGLRVLAPGETFATSWTITAIP